LLFLCLKKFSGQNTIVGSQKLFGGNSPHGAGPAHERATVSKVELHFEV